MVSTFALTQFASVRQEARLIEDGVIPRLSENDAVISRIPLVRIEVTRLAATPMNYKDSESRTLSLDDDIKSGIRGCARLVASQEDKQRRDNLVERYGGCLQGVQGLIPVVATRQIDHTRAIVAAGSPTIYCGKRLAEMATVFISAVEANVDTSKQRAELA